MQIRVGELIALTSGDGATDRASMFFAGMTADSASAQSRGHWIGVPTAHSVALVLAVTGDISLPSRWTAGVDALLATRLRGARAWQAVVLLDGTAAGPGVVESQPHELLTPG